MVEAAATGVDILVLFSCPETYGPSYIVGHFVNVNMDSQAETNVIATPAETYG
jgi:hypothetical protein